jgi:hypothetical protein
MYEEVLRDIEGIATFPTVSLIVFSVVFGAVLVWAARQDRDRLARLARLPLDADRDAQPSPPGRELQPARDGGRR